MLKPVLQAMVLADHVYQDVSGKFIICGTFTRLWFIRHNAPPGAKTPQTFETPSALIQAVAKAGSPHLYVALTGVRGEIELKLRYTV